MTLAKLKLTIRSATIVHYPERSMTKRSSFHSTACSWAIMKRSQLWKTYFEICRPQTTQHLPTLKCLNETIHLHRVLHWIKRRITETMKTLSGHKNLFSSRTRSNAHRSSRTSSIASHACCGAFLGFVTLCGQAICFTVVLYIHTNYVCDDSKLPRHEKDRKSATTLNHITKKIFTSPR